MTTHELHSDEIALLREEIEMLMAERASLLKVVGAAAVFVAEIDTSLLPADTYDAAEILAESLNSLREDSLRDALESVHAHLDRNAAGNEVSGEA